MAGGGCGAKGGSPPAPKPRAGQGAEAGGPWGKDFNGLHHPQGAQSSAARREAAAVGVLPSLTALAPSPHVALELRPPKGHHHPVCKILGWWTSSQLAGRGSGMSRGQPEGRWQRWHEPRGAGWVATLMVWVAEPRPTGAGKGHKRRQVGMDQPAAAAAWGSVIRTPSLVCVPPRRVAAGGAGAARGCGALPAAGAAIVCLQSRCFRQNQKHQLGKSSSQKILRLQNRSSKTPKRESV